MRGVSQNQPESTVPRPALRLGLVGLLPSIATLATMLAWPAGQDLLARLGVAYGAVIVSFIGGTWWGMACSRATPEILPRLVALSAVPSLIAWPIMLAPPATAYVVLAITFAVLVPTDRRLQAAGLAPAWWTRLRRPLSLAMAALHAAMALVLLVSPAG